MRQKELRLALVCYGGVSLAVYMHGITKEIWHLARASQGFHQPGPAPLGGVAEAYRAFLAEIEREDGLRLRVLPDILTGASAGGINAVFLAQAIHSGHSLEPLTDLWLENADVSELTDPEAEPVWRYAKLLGAADCRMVPDPSRQCGERDRLARNPRRSAAQGITFSCAGAGSARHFRERAFPRCCTRRWKKMAQDGDGITLLPPGHPIDLAVTANRFFAATPRPCASIRRQRSRRPNTACRSVFGREWEAIPLNRSPIRSNWCWPRAPRQAFRAPFRPCGSKRSTGFPRPKGSTGPRVTPSCGASCPVHMPRRHGLMTVALIDGSVLVNAPFGAALGALHGRPAQREVDRRFVYIDSAPRHAGIDFPRIRRAASGSSARSSALCPPYRAKQPIRDDLERIEQQSPRCYAV